MKRLLIICLCSLFHIASAQLPDTDPDAAMQERLEDLSEASESESEDDYDLQQLARYASHPLDINGDRASLTEFPLLDALHVENLLQYRRLLGNLISVYELQAVPGFNAGLIRGIIPYITVAGKPLGLPSLRGRFLAGSPAILWRSAWVPEAADGFRADSTGASKYPGSRIKTMLRYTYQNKDLLQYGVLADQDAGERFLFRRPQWGFDFYSLHLFARKLGVVKALALGDYSVNLGQGLVQWQSQAFNKSADVTAVKRQSETLRPYRSAGEYNFLRGAGITLKKGLWESTGFVSYRNLSASTGAGNGGGTVITSIQTSGLHRTATEQAGKNAVRMLVFGGNLRWDRGNAHFGLNAVHDRYSLPMQKRDEPYNLYAIRGRTWSNFSVDYSLSYRNYHFFGEAAADGLGHPAGIAGCMASLAPALDLAVLVRAAGAAYQTVFGNAFTENSLPTNERGLYLGLTMHPAGAWTLGVYADFFRFPWLRYRADAPGSGMEYFAQAGWQPSKSVTVYSRFRYKRKPINESIPSAPGDEVEDRLLRNWRTNVVWKISRQLELRHRLELCWFGAPADHPDQGFLLYTDLQYSPRQKPCSVSFRWQVFETAGYDTRLYAYENNVLFASSTPAFFGSGNRLYVNIKARVKGSWLGKYTLNTGLRAATTRYTGQAAIGSGLDRIPGRRKSDLTLQFFLDRG